MKIFVTGATGFVGHHLVEKILQEQKDIVYCFVRDEKKFSFGDNPRIKILQGDSESIEQYTAIIQSCEIIFHIGARADFGDGAAYQRDNIEFTNALIRIASGSKKINRFVFTSTIGAVDRMKSDSCESPLTESSIPNPSSDYGKSKLICEQSLRESKLPYVILRPVLVYGPGMRRNSHLRVFIDAVAKGKMFSKINFPGKLSFVHVHDLVSSLLLVSRHPKALRQTYFVSDDEPISLGNVFQTIGEVLGIHAGRLNIAFSVPQLLRIVRAYLPFQAQNLFSDVLTASNSTLRLLGFVPKVNYKQGFLDTAHDHFRQEHPQRGIAVITGGASGIGKSLCTQLHANGYSIVIVDVDQERGTEVANSLQGEYLEANLSDERDVKRVILFLQKNVNQISLLVNNAGIGKRGFTEEIPIDELTTMLAINCEAPVKFINAVLPSFIKRGVGTIINIGSSAGYQPLPYMAVYAASKAFVIRYTLALQGELRGRQVPESVRIILASPSGTATNFQKNSGVKNDDSAKLLNPNDVAAEIIRHLVKGSNNIIIGSSGKGMAFAARLLPTRFQIKLWERLMKVMR